ncbi:Thioredoxin family protein [Trichomonas vaginalis G3]|uniref:protein disulfide-isomerase n=1 Tax=Trichomonas vaginalis (strain ATCC PRA-98 / G3) TaxID=412133 RepID=A2FBH4_TRIV3|nr:intramolecular oxidoreductase activity, transposing S-S bonds [Trichomonas vaginalis G3]EAX97761.1 Thioredoxin family protein [Trichomonas vaginalis G3]KAI5491164.1 intramolecular oxidoreductase activity, transposing S-S bonds [Trichomonas vaginalis G3]|eukprot:XP_001310691.1 Thioredoxin family protein [Trichomonas vaginalis G3]
MFGLLLAIRVTTQNSSENLPNLVGSELENFVKAPGKSVVFFGIDYPQNIEYANYGIFKNKDSIRFCTAPANESEKFNVKTKSVIAFENGEIINSPFKAETSGLFLRWLNFIKNSQNYQVKTSGELKGLFNMEINTIFGVGIQTIPKEYATQSVFLVSPSLFKEIGLPDVESGLYLYRSCDRQLLQIKSSVEEISKCDVDSYNQSLIKTKPFVATYIVDVNDTESAEKMYSKLGYLKSKFGEKLFALALPREYIAPTLRQLKLESVLQPFFLIKNTTSRTERYFQTLEDGDIFDIKYIENYVAKVLNGELEPTPLSKAESQLNNYGPLKEVTRKSFKNLVLDSKNNTLVAVTAPWCGHCKRLKPVLNATAHVLHGTPNMLYVYDDDANDKPSEFPEIDGYPTLLLWNGTSPKPMQFEGSRNMKTIIEFLHNNTVIPFDIPEYNETEILGLYK